MEPGSGRQAGREGGRLDCSQGITASTPPSRPPCHPPPLPSRAGCAGLLDNLPLADAGVIDRLQQRGALVLAKTSMGEMVGGRVGRVGRAAGRQGSPRLGGAA